MIVIMNFNNHSIDMIQVYINIYINILVYRLYIYKYVTIYVIIQAASRPRSLISPGVVGRDPGDE